ncbi:hypothetical protein MRX96_035768 [Rhipicephalus microplus]
MVTTRASGRGPDPNCCSRPWNVSCPQQFLLPDNKSQQDSLGERWAALRGRPAQDCVRIYLNCVRKWPLCGARLFAAKMKSKEQQSLWLAVSEDGISLLDCVTLQPWVQHPYSSVMTFGGCQEDFMLVVCPEAGEPCTERLLFAMPKAQVLEVTLLVADYMNALGATGASVAPSPGGSLVVGSARSRLNMNPCSRDLLARAVHCLVATTPAADPPTPDGRRPPRPDTGPTPLRRAQVAPPSLPHRAVAEPPGSEEHRQTVRDVVQLPSFPCKRQRPVQEPCLLAGARTFRH